MKDFMKVLEEELKIRKVSINDYDAVYHLMDQLGFPGSPERKFFRKVINKENYQIYLAQIGEKVVGLISIRFIAPLHENGNESIIEELVIDKEYRRQKIGASLVRFAIEKSRQLGCKEISVTTDLKRKGNKEFYEYCGFKELARFFEYRIEKP